MIDFLLNFRFQYSLLLFYQLNLSIYYKESYNQQNFISFINFLNSIII